MGNKGPVWTVEGGLGGVPDSGNGNGHIQVLEVQGYDFWELCTSEVKVDTPISDMSLEWVLGMIQAWWWCLRSFHSFPGVISLLYTFCCHVLQRQTRQSGC